MNATRRATVQIIGCASNLMKNAASPAARLMLNNSRQFSSLQSRIPQQNIFSSVGPVTSRYYATKGDRELSEFLQSEIADEKKAMVAGIPQRMGEFECSADRAFLTFKRKFNDETITISLDVNHSVDADAPAETSQNAEEVELKSRPSFEIDIKKGSRTLSFTCSFMDAEQDPQQDTVQDVFGINEVTMFDAEHADEDYAVSGDILDENLYDLFMNYLDERGVTNDFASQVGDLCSDYEHSLYVGLLEKVKDFVK